MWSDQDAAAAPLPGPRKLVRRRRRLPYLGIVVALGTFAALAVGVEVAGKPCFAFDLVVSRAIQGAPWPSAFGPFMRGVSWAGDNIVLAGITVGGAGLILFLLRARREVAVILLAVATEQVVKIGLKELIARPRPSPDLVIVAIHTNEVFSFPSGHTVHYVVFLGFLWYLVHRQVRARRLRWPLLAVLGILVASIGLSRVYLGAHWVTDVVGGYLLGGAILTATVCVYRTWSERSAVVSGEGEESNGREVAKYPRQESNL
jgi:undecaprenyl-diphosphatase